MGKKATIINKSTKTPVIVYRMFLKLSMVCAVLALYMLVCGSTIPELATVLLIALICAAAYAVCYYIYKFGTKSEHETASFQILMLKRFLFYLCGICIILLGAELQGDNYRFIAAVLYALGLIFCQLLHNNKKIYSHLSTFSENFAAGLALVAMKMMYDNIKNVQILIVIGASIVFFALAEFFYHYFSFKKHGGEKTKSDKKPSAFSRVFRAIKFLFCGILLLYRRQKGIILRAIIGDSGDDQKNAVRMMRFEQFERNVFAAIDILVVWFLLVLTDSIQLFVGANTYEKATKLLPIAISLVTVSVLIWNNFIKAQKEERLLFDIKVSVSQFRTKLMIKFGNNMAVKAFDYVTGYMTRKNGYARWNGDNYFVHPIAVAAIILEYAEKTSDEEIAVALLHDCAEDLINDKENYGERLIGNTDKKGTPIPLEWKENPYLRQKEYLEFIEKEYNSKVMKTLELVTKGYTEDGVAIDYDNEDNMRQYLECISTSISAAKIKIADRMNNNSTLTVCSDEKKRKKTVVTRRMYLPFARKISDDDRVNAQFYELAAKFFEQEIV